MFFCFNTLEVLGTLLDNLVEWYSAGSLFSDQVKKLHQEKLWYMRWYFTEGGGGGFLPYPSLVGSKIA